MRSPFPIAHQGGWDEIALFAIPVVAALVAIRIVEKRQRKRRALEADQDGDHTDSGEVPEPD